MRESTQDQKVDNSSMMLRIFFLLHVTDWTDVLEKNDVPENKKWKWSPTQSASHYNKHNEWNEIKMHVHVCVFLYLKLNISEHTW